MSTTTLLDRLVYAAARYKDDQPVYAHFLSLLRQHELTMCQWPEMSEDELGEPLEGTQRFWEINLNLCIAGRAAVGPCDYEPMIMPGLQNVPHELMPDTASWGLKGYLMFQSEGDNFDLIPLMELNNTRVHDIVWPDMQLRFEKTEQGWVWYPSPTGFVNGVVYDSVLESLPPAARKRVDAAVEFTGNWILRQLGGYERLLAQPGEWDKLPPKPARVKHNKKGKVKKIHQIAKLGHQIYRPEV